MLPATFTKQKILARVRHENGCWIWTGCDNGKYGIIATFKEGNFYAHRVSYEIWKGPIPAFHYVCHSCDTPRCVNPDHLFAGTAAENAADMRAKKRHAHGDKQPTAKLTELQVIEVLQSEESSAVLARRYGVSEATISMIRSGRIWAHVETNRRNVRWAKKHRREVNPGPRPWKHGTATAYSYRGCRCEQCTAAYAVKNKQQRDARKAKQAAA